MKVKLIPRKNPQNREADPKYYAEPQYEGTIDIDFIARQIAGRSSLTAGDIKNVLSNFLEEMPTYMLLGRSVKLNELGTFRISFSSEGAVSESNFRASMIKGLKIIYTPDVNMKNRIKDGITYEVVRSKKDEPGEPENPFE
ncbi:MAG: HU family DNA-binding protein [Bacteroides sp.]|uniref:HU family DNA-binding protein n=1 Tax=Bacteroides sp. TaxID=29523 RepID=UPI002FC6563A